MVLKSLEMQGFKSFPDKTVLKFGKGITAVVGPNGSGKSNISDAVRWVLGEQRTKSLRGSKMEDVVFGGTTARRAQGFAEVTLTLDNTDKTIAEKGETISVTRRYYRSGESEYKIDGAPVRLKDIHELFMDTGLGRDGYSMIGQGKIDGMISSKGEERREIFEEAAGISRFRYRRTDAQRRLSQAQENLVRLLDILAELEGRVEPLRIQSEKAQQFLELAQEKKELEIGLWLHKMEASKVEFREQEHKITLATAQYEQAEQELKRTEEEIEKLAQQMAELTVQVDEIRRNSSRLEGEAAGKESEAAVLENTVLHNGETITRISRERDEAADTGQYLDNQIALKENQMEELTMYARKKKEELSQTEAALNEMQGERARVADRLALLSSEIAALSQRLADCRVQGSTAASSAEEILSRGSVVDETLQNRRDELELVCHQKQDSEENLKFCIQRMEELQNAVSGYALRVNSRRSKAEEAKKELGALQLQYEQKKQRARMLEDLEKNMEGYTGSVKLVMRQAKTGALGGIHGPVSQLITVDEPYSVAIETALGAAMQNIVTSTENDAKRAIQYLKENRGGRATFLPVSAIRGRTLQEKGLEDCLGFVDIAINLTRCDGKYREILSSLLGRTVVAEDMDSAIGIAKRYGYRLRIVTLDGQLINAGGSMTGGSRTQNAGILSRSTEIEKLKQEMLSLQERGVKAKQKQKELTEELAACVAEYEGAQGDLARAAEDKIRQEGEDKLIAQQMVRIEESVRELTEEKENSQKRMEALLAQSRRSQSDMEALREEIEKSEEQMQALNQSRGELSGRREELSNKISELNMELLTAQKDIQAAKETAEELRERRLSHSDRAQSIETEIAEIQAKNERLVQAANALKAEADELRVKASSSQQEIEQALALRQECEKRSGQLRLLERSKAGEREKLSGELARLEERKAAMLKEYDETINKLYDDYQLTRREAEEIGVEIPDIPKAQRRLLELKGKIRGLGSVNVGAIEEYKEVSERYEFLKGQIEDVERSRDELSKLIDELTRNMSEKFQTQFDKINEKFKVCFSEFFNGGKGELRLEDPRNVLESNIEIKVQPPGKNVQNIDLLSGGEKSLAAIALLFSILKVTPAPFCIYDEVEAALDDVNVDRFAKYMRRMTDKTQFISITHRRGTMEEADILYGVTMQEKGVSKLLELKTSELAKKLGI